MTDAARTGLTPVVAAPEEVRLRGEEGLLTLHWPDGEQSDIGFATLRAACGCSSCRAQRQRGSGPEIPPDVAVNDVEVVGASALRLVFSDGHGRGLYPWRYLLELGRGTAEL